MVVNDALVSIEEKLKEIPNLNVDIWNVWNIEPQQLPHANIYDKSLENRPLGGVLSAKDISVEIMVATIVREKHKEEDREAFFALLNEILQKIQTLPQNIDFLGYNRDVAAREYTFYGAVLKFEIHCSGATYEA